MEIHKNSWSVRTWRVPCLGELELMHAVNLTHNYPLHIHEQHCLVMMLRGVETHIRRGENFTAFPGDLMFLNADEAHSSKSVGSEYRVIYFQPEMLTEIVSELVGSKLQAPYFPEPVIRDPQIVRVLSSLHSEFERKLYTLEHESMIISTLETLFERHSAISPGRRIVPRESRRVKTVQEYLKSNYLENVSLATLASIVNLSPFHFLRTFRDYVGIPPHEYQTQLRVVHAKRLIQDGHSISNAAMESGFFDQSHFSRNFKRIVGLTPGTYASHSNIVQEPAE